MTLSKNSRIFCSTLIASLAIQSRSFAFSGGSSDGGGKVVSCKSEPLRLLDLWEAFQDLDPLLKLRPVYSTSPVDGQESVAIDRLKKAFELYGDLADPLGMGLDENHDEASDVVLGTYLHQVADTFVFNKINQPGPFSPLLSPHTGQRLELTQDSYERVIPKEHDCIQQAINYDDTGEIAYMDMDLINQLNPTDRAALYAHEAFYKVLRVFSDEASSVRARRAIGYIMSGYSFSTIRSNLPKERIFCESSDHKTRVNIFPYANGGSSRMYGLAAEMIAGVRLIGYSTPSVGIGANSVQEFYGEFVSPSVSAGDSPLRPLFNERPWHSAVDYDLTYELDTVINGGVRKVYIKLNSSPGKTHVGDVVEVSCGIIKDPG